jgi:transcriptional antiterminator RfaH
MDWSKDKSWFAIHAKRFRETAASLSVQMLGLEVFLPMARVECTEHTVIKVDRKPLFPSYFFARFDPENSLGPVESARGVLHVIKSGGSPIPIDDHILCELQSRVQEDGMIRLQHREFRPGDRVSIHEGPFAGMLGRVEAELDDRRRVAILLETLWNARVLIEKHCVENELT